MRFVAGRGAVAKLLQAGDRRHRGLPAGTLQRRAIGKMLLARGAAAKSHREDAAGRECHGEEDGGTVAESHREELPAGAPWQSCWPGEPWKTVGSGHGN